MVIGTGGYVCWPVLSAAHSLKKFTAMHESNAEAGLCTRLLSDKVDILLLGQKSEDAVKNGVFAGNPIRKAFYTINRKEARSKLGIGEKETLILSVGGSIGAEKLNDACINLMRNYSLSTPGIVHVHACGKRYYDAVISEFGDTISNKKCKIVPFINDMATHLHAADLVISRCGAMTLSEIAYCSVPSILIPSPNVTNDHQTKNASHYSKMGASVMIEEKELTEQLLRNTVRSLIENKPKRIQMKIAAKEISVDNAAAKCVDIIIEKYKNR
jgi:UDP-N-acetylglucosamine--N-acetylmuramyl-(pentapeptide) pyrophosphoryl-undecaprenol N-acetylglucosamine transferase